MGDELKSCPFCGTEMKRHDHCFAHPRPEDGDCILRHYSFDKTKAGAWNTRTETQSQATIDELVEVLELILADEEVALSRPDYERAREAIAKAGGQS